MDNLFNSPTFGKLSLEKIRIKILDFMSKIPDAKYRLIIGSDSQPKNGSEVDFVTAILVHRIGHGGIYFWQRVIKKRKYVLRERIYEEATLSLALADKFLEICKNDGIHRYDLEIHVDIGKIGETRDLINEVVGMIRGSGYEVKVKPESYCASKVADRHT